MRLRSTVESVAKGEPSQLAIVETILAVLVSLFIAIQYRTITHLVVGAVIAPFLFLRTKDITRDTIKWFEERRAKKFKFELFNSVFIITMPLQCGLVKSYYTLQYLFNSPKTQLRAIPKNWFSLCLTTDICHPPEMIPGAGAYSRECATEFYWNDYLEVLQVWAQDEAAKEPSRFWKYFIRFSNVTGMLLNVLLFFVISYVYRFFVKSTAIIYFPLLWVGRREKTTKSRAKTKETRDPRRPFVRR